MDPVIMISIVAFVGIVALVFGLSQIMGDMGNTAAEERLDVMTGRKSGEDQVTKGELMKEAADGMAGTFSKLVERFGNIELLFEQADMKMRLEVFLAISAGVGALGIALGFLFKAPIPLVPVIGLMTAILPLFWVLFCRKRRFKKFAQQLPDAMELIGRALRSGHSLSSGLHVVVDEMPEPISAEFAKAYEEQNLGIPIEQSLKNMLKRIPNLDLKFFVTAVAIQRQAGGDLAEILDKIGHIIRERFKIMGQVAALTGEGRISGIVLMALPIGLFFTVYYLNPDYVMLLFTEEIGRKMILFGIVTQILGAVAIKKIINIKI